MSQSTKQLEEQLTNLLAEVTAYNDAPTKANSKRVRTGLGSIKKQTSSIRAELVSLDKKGYN